MIALTFVLLAVAAAGFVIRLLLGPSLADRVLAVDGFLMVVTAALVVDAARSERTWFVDVAVVVGLLGYVGTGIASRLIEDRGN